MRSLYTATKMFSWCLFLLGFGISTLRAQTTADAFGEFPNPTSLLVPSGDGQRIHNAPHQGLKNTETIGYKLMVAGSHARLAKIADTFVRIIDRGGFGIVYYGELENGTRVVVKLWLQSSPQEAMEFLAEAQKLNKSSQRSLVSLIGYCNDSNYLVFVCEFMPRGSLQEHLKGKAGLHVGLTWTERLHIAYEAAQGLDYLHRGCEPTIIHADVKSSNILLVEHLEAKIADFGLSKDFPQPIWHSCLHNESGWHAWIC